MAITCPPSEVDLHSSSSNLHVDLIIYVKHQAGVKNIFIIKYFGTLQQYTINLTCSQLVRTVIYGVAFKTGKFVLVLDQLKTTK